MHSVLCTNLWFVKKKLKQRRTNLKQTKDYGYKHLFKLTIEIYDAQNTFKKCFTNSITKRKNTNNNEQRIVIKLIYEF